MKVITVDLGTRSYEVFVGRDLIGNLREIVDLDGVEHVVVVADRNAASAWKDALDERFGLPIPMTVMMMPGGEPTKALEVAGGLLNQMAELSMHRGDMVVTFGGGVVSDLGGFVASVYHRGLRVVHISTTLMGQVDASIGGKTAVNLKSGKNVVGTFYQPAAVISDVSTLHSLPEREYRAGLAEVVKYGLTLDPSLLSLLDDSFKKLIERDEEVLEEVVVRSAGLKAGVVSSDEFDTGERIVLNYGHTFGHALEAAGGFGDLLHGEAVAVGMVCAAELSRDLGLLDEQTVSEHVRLLEMFGLPTSATFDSAEVIRFMEIDKKYRSGGRWVLLKAIGEPVVEVVSDQAALGRAIEEVRRS